MRTASQILLSLLALGCGLPCATPVCAREDVADLTRERALLAESEAAREVLDFVLARTTAANAVTSLLETPEVDQDGAWLDLLDDAGWSSWAAQDLRTASIAWRRVYEVRQAALPEDHADLQTVRANLATTLSRLGDLAGARVLQEAVLEIYARTLPEEHPELLSARGNLAATLFRLGDLAGARALFEQVCEVQSRMRAEDDPALQLDRGNLAVTMKAMGDLAGARAMEERVLESLTRTLPEDHPDLQRARGNLAKTLSTLGDLAGAREMQEKVLESVERTLSDDHADLQIARQNLAGTMLEQGDLRAAKSLLVKVYDVSSRTLREDHPDLLTVQGNLASAITALGELEAARTLQEKVLEILTRTLPEDHPSLQNARGNLAATLHELGDLARARALFDKVLEVNERTLGDDHPDVQAARANLAVVLASLGDPAGARALQESVLEVYSRTLPEDHLDLQRARGNLAATLASLGDKTTARSLHEKALEVNSRTLPEDHPSLQVARSNLAVVLADLNESARARELEEKVLEVNLRTLPESHPSVRRARGNLAMTLSSLGDLAGARALQELALEASQRALPDDHPDLPKALSNLAETIAKQVARADRIGDREDQRIEGRKRCMELTAAASRASTNSARAAILTCSAREAEERCASTLGTLGLAVSFARGLGVFEPLEELDPLVLALSETTRGAALASAWLARAAAQSPAYSALRDSLRAASDDLAALASIGTTREEFERARVRREWAEQELVRMARESSHEVAVGLEFDLERFSARLTDREAAVGFRRHVGRRYEVVGELDASGQPAVREHFSDRLCAFVVRGSGGGATVGALDLPRPLALIDLGPVAPIEQAVREWRAGLGVVSDGRGRPALLHAESTELREPGVRLREMIFDPLLPALAGAESIVLVLDDVLHLVPFDALPLTESGDLVGDRWRIRTRNTFIEMMASDGRPPESGELLAFGDVDYGGGARDAGASTKSWTFSQLPATGVEVLGIRRCFEERFGADTPATLCCRTDATRERLVSRAPTARWLHIATHGWFAPESTRSWGDPEPLDAQLGRGLRQSGEDQVKRMSPMLLCGLALAGANRPEDAVGRVRGLVTAQELSTLDLRNCELAVLSACDTNVGERRAGQGVASLQRALQMAGARTVITSLWKVPDQATAELMLDFYRRLWIERTPKSQALWEAKAMLRRAVDERGAPIYTTRDWAAWVLTGDPD